jgi:hypothetical protein
MLPLRRNFAPHDLLPLMGKSGVDATITELQALPGGRRLVGIRHNVHDEPDADWLCRPTVRRGVSVVVAGLAFDLLVCAREPPAATAISSSKSRRALDPLIGRCHPHSTRSCPRGGSEGSFYARRSRLYLVNDTGQIVGCCNVIALTTGRAALFPVSSQSYASGSHSAIRRANT